MQENITVKNVIMICWNF